jgi:serine/threonine-protein kinase HipA
MGDVGLVYFNQVLAGRLERTSDGFSFTYEPSYLADSSNQSIALSFPKRPQPFSSEHLFPFFAGLLSEGENRDIQSAVLKIDGRDLFSLLLATASRETIGAVTVRASP